MSFPRYPKYKASGVEWLGEVPEGWTVLPLKRIVSVPITDGPHETPQFVEEGVPFVSAEAVSSGQIDFTKVRACISLEDNARYSKKYSPKRHDIYMVKSGATTGVTAIVEDRTDFNIWSPLAVIRCNSGSVPHFVLNFMGEQKGSGLICGSSLKRDLTPFCSSRTDFNIWSPLAVIRCNSGSVPHFVLNFMGEQKGSGLICGSSLKRDLTPFRSFVDRKERELAALNEIIGQARADAAVPL